MIVKFEISFESNILNCIRVKEDLEIVLGIQTMTVKCEVPSKAKLSETDIRLRYYEWSHRVYQHVRVSNLTST